jgi:nifR3 family TIM-barrel protein
VDVPVTVKIRKGYSKTEVNAVEVAKACEDGGAAAITVHGRTRDQMYAPPVDIDIIRAVKQAVSVPVIGNGDVVSAESAVRMYEQTGCDFVMVGRGALGAPWVFSQIEAYFSSETLLPEPPVAKRMEILCRQVALAVQLKGERGALLEARKHASWYMRELRGAATLRGEAGTISTMEDLRALCYRAIKRQEE